MGLLDSFLDDLADAAKGIKDGLKEAWEELTGGERPEPVAIPIPVEEKQNASSSHQYTAIGGSLNDTTLSDYTLPSR